MMHLDECLGLAQALYEVLFHRGEQHHAPEDFRDLIRLVNVLEDKLRKTQRLQAEQYEEVQKAAKRAAPEGDQAAKADATAAGEEHPTCQDLYAIVDDAYRLRNYVKGADEMSGLMGPNSGTCPRLHHGHPRTGRPSVPDDRRFFVGDPAGGVIESGPKRIVSIDTKTEFCVALHKSVVVPHATCP